MAAAAAFWGLITMRFMSGAEAIRNAGFDSPDELFDTLISSPSAVITAVEEYEDSWQRVSTEGGKIRVGIPELYDELRGLASDEPPGGNGDWPFLLSAGERRSFTANVLFRNPEWRKKDRAGALRISPDDARDLGLEEGDLARHASRPSEPQSKCLLRLRTSCKPDTSRCRTASGSSSKASILRATQLASRQMT